MVRKRDYIDVSIVIPSYNRKEKLLRLIRSVKQSEFRKLTFEIMVIDNGSKDGTQTALKSQFPDVMLSQQRVNSYSGGARNIGARIARGKYIFFIDDDNVLHPRCIQQLSDYLDRNDNTGMVGPLMLDYNHKDIIWCAGGKLTPMGMPKQLYFKALLNNTTLPEVIENIDYLPNAFMIRKEVMLRTMHDVDNFPHNWAEQDLGQRIMAHGYNIVSVLGAVTYHDFGAFTLLTRISEDRTLDQARSRILYRRKYVRRLLPWLYFWLVVFPGSTAYYFKEFFKIKDYRWARLVKAYLYGTYLGIRQPLQ
jgi:GT2 family glycosyltransferase